MRTWSDRIEFTTVESFRILNRVQTISHLQHVIFFNQNQSPLVMNVNG